MTALYPKHANLRTVLTLAWALFVVIELCARWNTIKPSVTAQPVFRAMLTFLASRLDVDPTMIAEIEKSVTILQGLIKRKNVSHCVWKALVLKEQLVPHPTIVKPVPATILSRAMAIQLAMSVRDSSVHSLFLVYFFKNWVLSKKVLFFVFNSCGCRKARMLHRFRLSLPACMHWQNLPEPLFSQQPLSCWPKMCRHWQSAKQICCMCLSWWVLRWKQWRMLARYIFFYYSLLLWHVTFLKLKCLHIFQLSFFIVLVNIEQAWLLLVQLWFFGHLKNI